MPVILDLAIACLLSLLLIRVYSKFPKDEIIKDGIIYLAAVLIAGIFKQSFIFFALGILVFSKNLKWVIIWLVGILIVFASVNLYGKYFLAAPYVQNLKSLDYLLKLNFIEFYNANKYNFHVNILEFKSKTAAPVVYIAPYYLVLLPIIAFILNLKQRSRFIFAMTIISSATLISYLAFYTTLWDYFVRISIPLVFVNCLLVIFFKGKIKTILKYLILTLFILSLPFSINEVIKNQDIKKNNYDYINHKMPDFKRITMNLNNNTINTILIDPDFYKVYGFEQFLIALPQDKGDNIVRYTVNYRTRDKFALHGKIKVDFALTPKPENIPNTSLVEQTDYYYLYKFNN
jgi:hypothetical protein